MSEKKNINEYPKNVRIAAKWWTRAMFDPILREDFSFFEIIEDYISLRKKEITQKKLDDFELAIAEIIQKELNETTKDFIRVYSHNGPGPLLNRALKTARINKSVFYPVYASMRIYENRVQVMISFRNLETVWEEDNSKKILN